MASRGLVAAIVALVLVTAVVGCGSPATQEGSGSPAASGQSAGGQALVDQKCTMCHPIDRVNAVNYDRAQWEATVDRMVSNGLVVTAEERQAIIDYLAETDAAP